MSSGSPEFARRRRALRGCGKGWDEVLRCSEFAGDSRERKHQGVEASHIWNFELSKTDAGMDRVWKELNWSLEHLLTGLWPTVGSEGNAFPAGTLDADRAGSKLAGVGWGVQCGCVGFESRPRSSDECLGVATLQQ